MSNKYHCIDVGEYDAYWVYDISKLTKTQEDFWNEEEGYYDSQEYDIYVMECCERVPLEEANTLLNASDDTIYEMHKLQQEALKDVLKVREEKRELEFKLNTLKKWYNCPACAFNDREFKYLRSLRKDKAVVTNGLTAENLRGFIRLITPPYHDGSILDLNVKALNYPDILEIKKADIDKSYDIEIVCKNYYDASRVMEFTKKYIPLTATFEVTVRGE